MANIQELGKKSKGAPIGNTNSASAYDIKSAIRWALAQEYGEIERGKAMKAIMQKAVQDALEGDKAAREYISERLEGKPSQTTIVQGDEGKPLHHKVTWEVVKPK